MSLSLQAVKDPATDQNFRQIAEKFPIQGEDLSANAAGLAGGVSGAGTVEAGSGFTVAKTATGRYKVTLDKALPVTAVMVASPNRTGLATWLNVSGPSKTEFTVETFGINFAGSSIEDADSSFTFNIKQT